MLEYLPEVVARIEPPEGYYLRPHQDGRTIQVCSFQDDREADNLVIDQTSAGYVFHPLMESFPDVNSLAEAIARHRGWRYRSQPPWNYTLDCFLSDTFSVNYRGLLEEWQFKKEVPITFDETSWWLAYDAETLQYKAVVGFRPDSDGSIVITRGTTSLRVFSYDELRRVICDGLGLWV